MAKYYIDRTTGQRVEIKSTHKIRNFVVFPLAGLFVLFLAIGLTGPGQHSSPTAEAGASESLTQTPTPSATPTGPATQFGDGTYKVGTDIAPGSYKSSGPRPGGVGQCYWARMRDDSGDVTGIIANNLSAGPTRFTTKAGEYVQITGCDFALE